MLDHWSLALADFLIIASAIAGGVALGAVFMWLERGGRRLGESLRRWWRGASFIGPRGGR